MKNLSLFVVALLTFTFTAMADDPAAPKPPVDNDKTLVAPDPKGAETAKAEAPKENYDGAQGELKKTIEALFEDSKKVNAPGGGAEKARGAIGNAMDWDRIAKECMGQGNWKKQSAANQAEFKKTLRDVIEKSAYSRLDKFWDGTSYKFEKIDVKKDEASVPTKFTVGGKAFTLEYFMNKKNGKWLIHDIAYERERYSTNIHEQIDAFLKEKGFKDLMDKLKKRRDELAAENRSAKKG